MNYIKSRTHPGVVLAASGMCAGGRIVNYLKAMMDDPRHGRPLHRLPGTRNAGPGYPGYGPRGGWVDLDGRRFEIRAGVHTLGGYRPMPARTTWSISSGACG